MRPTGLSAIRSLDYTVLLCEDVNVMARFYEDVLGFELATEVAGRWAEFEIGGSLLAMRLRSRPYDGPGTERASVHLAFRVPPAEVVAASRDLTELGVELLEPVQDIEDFGHRAFFFADPEGNVIEIYADI